MVARVADTQTGEAGTLGSVGAMCSAALEGGNVSVCEADNNNNNNNTLYYPFRN